MVWPFLAPSAYPPLVSTLRLLALWVLAAAPHLWWSVCVCGVFLRRQSCVFFLSSCSAWGRLWLRLFWCGFCASSCGAGGFPRRVLPQATLRGFRNLSGSSCLSCSCSGALLRGLRCLGAPLGFPPCAVLFLRGLRLAQVTLGGFLPFLSPGACPTAALVA